MQINGANVYRQVGQPGVRIEANSAVVGWDDHEMYSQRVRNYTGSAIEVEVRRAFPGHVDFQSQLKPVLFDFQTVEFTATVDAGKKQDFLFQITRRQGHNAKQNNVTLVDGIVQFLSLRSISIGRGMLRLHLGFA